MRAKPQARDLILDAGVLEATGLLELFGWTGVAAVGGIAVMPWRPDWLAGRAAGVTAIRGHEELGDERFAQCVVHLQKSRAATWAALSEGWHHLSRGGGLLLCGGNELGIKSAVRRLQGELHQDGTTLTNRARARVVRFVRTQDTGPTAPEGLDLRVRLGDAHHTLRSSVGVFSAEEVDPGTRLVLDRLATLPAARQIFDPGCGVGMLGLAALLLWPASSAVLADADWRAVRSARSNAATLEVQGRCDVAWWDALSETPPTGPCDLVLLNPPFHSGTSVDLSPARAMFRAIAQCLAPGGRALVVANRTLPYERDLRPLGRLKELEVRQGYKLLEVLR